MTQQLQKRPLETTTPIKTLETPTPKNTP